MRPGDFALIAGVSQDLCRLYSGRLLKSFKNSQRYINFNAPIKLVIATNFSLCSNTENCCAPKNIKNTEMGRKILKLDYLILIAEFQGAQV